MSAMGQFVFVIQEALMNHGRGEAAKILMREYGLSVQEAVRMVKQVEADMERFENAYI